MKYLQIKDSIIKTIVSNSLVLPKLSPTRIWRKETKAYFGGTFDDAFLHWPDIADFRAEGGHTLHISPKIKDEGTLKLFTDAEATGLIYLQQGYFLLHASCILINNKAYIFVGTPGAGKSTTVAAFVKAGNAPLADDMTVITFQDINSTQRHRFVAIFTLKFIVIFVMAFKTGFEFLFFKI